MLGCQLESVRVAYSKDAYTMLPWMASVVGTRGTVLVTLGKYEEGLRLLKKSMEDATSPRSKAENACHMAIGFAQTGQHNNACEYLQLAKEIDAKCPLLARAERTLASAKAEVSSTPPRLARD